jgi:hypothetical protein
VGHHNYLYYLVLAVGIVSAIVRGRYRQRQGQRVLPSLAARAGLQFSATNPYDLSSYRFGLLQEGNDRGCENVLSGRWHDLQVMEADYWYVTRSGQPGARNAFSIAITDLTVALPYISITRRDIVPEITGPAGSSDFEFGSDAFSRQYRVKATDEVYAGKLVDESMMQWLLFTTGHSFAFEIQDSYLLVWSPRMDATDVASLLDMLKEFTEHIPPPVLTQYGSLRKSPPVPPFGGQQTPVVPPDGGQDAS